MYLTKNFTGKSFILFSILYIFINVLFTYKYGIRLNIFNIYILTLLYIFLLVSVIFLFYRINFSKKIYKNLFYIFSLTFFILSLWLNMTIDGETLNVDRWSAMETAIRALLNDQYPYASIDHLNGRTSNLPTLILIGIPFYYFGNVGYLQSFTFLLFMILIHDTFHNFKTRVFGLLLLVLSTSYGWEIYTKSDLMSNFIIILIFLVF